MFPALKLPVLALTACLVASLHAQSGSEHASLSASKASAHQTAAQLKLASARVKPGRPLTPRERALQYLNRFTYGPRPGDVERVLAVGPDAWLEQQMLPATIKDGAAEAAMRNYPTLTMTAEQAAVTYPTDGYVRQVADGKRPYPTDPLQASLYDVQIFRYRAVQNDATHHPVELTDEQKADKKKVDQATAARVTGLLLALPKKERIAALNAMPVEDRIAFAENMAGDGKTAFLADLQPREREMISAMQGSANVSYKINQELGEAKIVRSIDTERQLQEVMTDFWFNHFNIYGPKDSDQWYTTAYERDTIRPHALGKFRDLLLATAESPAMMVYLDNWLSIGPGSLANGVNPQNPKSKPGNRGLNENYGREVMELHTLGVNGGYTQADVTHLAAILTGWGVDDPGHGGGFLYDPKKHEPGTKSWFGYTIDDAGNVVSSPPGAPTQIDAALLASAPDGMKQGVAALVILAGSPQTAHFLSFKLAQRFVADEPPPALVERMAAAYIASDGDVRAVLRAMASSPEFNSRRYFRNKVKTPFEFVVSAFRATQTEPQNPSALLYTLDRVFGEAPYRALPPTGYYITADHWMNTQSLLARLNFADQLTHGKFPNQKFDASRVLALALLSDQGVPAAAGKAHRIDVADTLPRPAAGAEVALRVLEGSLIGGEISLATDRFIHSQLAGQAGANATDTLNLLTALLLGSPEFQSR